MKNKFVNAMLALSISLFSCGLPQNTVILSDLQSTANKNLSYGNVTLSFDNLVLKNNGFKVSSVDFNNTSIKKLKLEVTGLGINSPVSQTISWVPGQTATFNLSVFSGTNRILTLSAMDSADNVIGSLMGSIDVIANQNNSAKVSFFETSVAQVLLNILNSSNPNVLSVLKNSDLRNFVKTVTSFDEVNNKFAAINPSKLDTKKNS